MVATLPAVVGEGQESDNGATVDVLDQIGLSILKNGVAIPRQRKTLKVTITIKLTNMSPIKTFTRSVRLTF